MTDRNQTLADVTPDSGVHQRDAPIRWSVAQDFDLPAKIRNRTVAVCGLLVVQEVILDDVRPVSKTKNEILMAVLAIVLHDVPQDGLLADRHHWFRNGVGILTDTGAKPAAEQNNFHGPITSTLGIGITILQPQEPAWEICPTISLFKFHGRIRR